MATRVRLGRLAGHVAVSATAPRDHRLQVLANAAASSASGGMTGSGPLAGVKVIDMTQFLNGPSATCQLADNGADVLKVEPPVGDGSRAGAALSPVMWDYRNRGKRSMVLDMKNPKAMEVMKRLVEWADVICDNFRPDVMDRLGLSYEQCRAWNPRIIYASNSGFGAKGEWALRQSYDGVAQAFSGVTTVMGGGPSHPPRFVEWGFSDEVGAMNFYASILAALFARSQTGLGQQVITSQTGATLHFSRNQLMMAAYEGKQRNDGKEPVSAMGHIQQMHCGSDGLWFVVTMGRQPMFHRWCRDVLGRPELLESPGAKTFPANSPADRALFLDSAREVCATKPRDHWIELCQKHEVPAGPCASYAEIVDPEHSIGRHMRENDYIRTVTHRDFGDNFTVVAPPSKFSQTPPEPKNWHAPDLGEHTAEVLASLGFSEAEKREMTQPDGPTPPGRGPFARKTPR